jgi:hypothetical protein
MATSPGKTNLPYGKRYPTGWLIKAIGFPDFSGSSYNISLDYAWAETKQTLPSLFVRSL